MDNSTKGTFHNIAQHFEGYDESDPEWGTAPPWDVNLPESVKEGDVKFLHNHVPLPSLSEFPFYDPRTGKEITADITDKARRDAMATIAGL
jgi:hypothetical protein